MFRGAWYHVNGTWHRIRRIRIRCFKRIRVRYVRCPIIDDRLVEPSPQSRPNLPLLTIPQCLSFIIPLFLNRPWLLPVVQLLKPVIIRETMSIHASIDVPLVIRHVFASHHHALAAEI